jgi:hypothetical protein
MLFLYGDRGISVLRHRRNRETTAPRTSRIPIASSKYTTISTIAHPPALPFRAPRSQQTPRRAGRQEQINPEIVPKLPLADIMLSPLRQTMMLAAWAEGMQAAEAA